MGAARLIREIFSRSDPRRNEFILPGLTGGRTLTRIRGNYTDYWAEIEADGSGVGSDSVDAIQILSSIANVESV